MISPHGPEAGAPPASCRVTVCICTYRRPELLERLLRALAGQQTAGRFSFSIVVADNDAERSAQRTVADCARGSAVPITYCVEPRKNIARARNKALEHSAGDYVAFIDDDEVPDADWLANHLRTCRETGASGSLGPVKPHYAVAPPAWALKGRFFERPGHPTGTRLAWHQTRTGNVLFKREVTAGQAEPFLPEFDTAGEDVDFFRRMMAQGHVFVWCDEAVVHEEVPASRLSRAYLLRRALLRGSNFPKQRTNRARSLAKSLVAVPAYGVLLPVLAVFGEHLFLRYLIKVLDHGARILAFAGVKVVSGRNI